MRIDLLFVLALFYLQLLAVEYSLKHRFWRQDFCRLTPLRLHLIAQIRLGVHVFYYALQKLLVRQLCGRQQKQAQGRVNLILLRDVLKALLYLLLS